MAGRRINVIWRHRSGPTLTQVMDCCLTAPSHYLNQCWLLIGGVVWHSLEINFAGNDKKYDMNRAVNSIYVPGMSLLMTNLRLHPHFEVADKLTHWVVMAATLRGITSMTALIDIMASFRKTVKIIIHTKNAYAVCLWSNYLAISWNIYVGSVSLKDYHVFGMNALQFVGLIGDTYVCYRYNCCCLLLLLMLNNKAHNIQ